MPEQIPVPLWRKIQKRSFTNWESLATFLQWSEKAKEKAFTNSHFPLLLPLRLAAKIKKKTLEDPILKQFLPTEREHVLSPDFLKDPVGESHSQKTTKLLHKYNGRALLLCTSCAMHCRYCFRKHFEYEKKLSFSRELDLLRNEQSINEIILSGGDPLSMGNEKLKTLVKDLEAIPHLKRLRFHSRFPIGIPERIDEGFLAILEESRFQTWFVTHSNHPQELDEDIFAAFKEIQRLGIPVINQSVLLKDVNDNTDTLQTLSEKLIDNGITPYYLHQLDKVQGAQHFEVHETIGKAIICELQKRLPGYGIPKYVREVSGEECKSSI